MRTHHHKFKRFPYKTIITTLALALLAFTILTTLAAMTFTSEMIINKTSRQINTAAQINMPVIGGGGINMNVNMPHTQEPTTTTTTTSTTSTTTIKIRANITYGVYHDATSGGWYDPKTGVGSKPSGNDPGACGGGLGR